MGDAEYGGPVSFQLFRASSNVGGNEQAVVAGSYRLRVWPTGGGGLLELRQPGEQLLWACRAHEVSVSWLGSAQCLVGGGKRESTVEAVVLSFPTDEEARVFDAAWQSAVARTWMSAALQRRSATATPTGIPLDSHLASSVSDVVNSYFVYYSRLSNQANMLQDLVRTEEYSKAILGNYRDFEGKRVMDVGAGSGVLSFFASRAGASRVYAVEASSAADIVKQLAQVNSSVGRSIEVIHKPVEMVDCESDLAGAKVDVLISEPIGIFLFNERMLESFLFARDRFLKPGGKMYPDTCRLFMAPFTDADLYQDFLGRPSFWDTNDFYGLDLSSVAPAARLEQFTQPIVDHINPEFICCRDHFCKAFDLTTINKDDLKDMSFEFTFLMETPRMVHGIAGWFDVLFTGSTLQCGFSTAPWAPPTHWYQIRFLFLRPLAVNEGDVVTGELTMRGNSDQSYNIEVVARIAEKGVETRTAVLDLKDPDYRYYSNPASCFMPAAVSST